MPLFSERYGYKEQPSLQYECISNDLRTSIYNAIYIFLGEYSTGSNQENICRDIWIEMWHLPLNEFPSPYYKFYQVLKRWLDQCEWDEAYDLIDFIGQWLERAIEQNNGLRISFHFGFYSEHKFISIDDYTTAINNMLERERSGYRLINGLTTPITNEQEISELEDCLKLAEPFSGARMHIEDALVQFSKRPEGDYRNTIKEAISAVESAVRTITGVNSGKLGKALDVLGEKYSIHHSLISGWKSLWGFTCDENGIRHSSDTDDVNVDSNLARYMLITCSAFTNYLVALASESQNK